MNTVRKSLALYGLVAALTLGAFMVPSVSAQGFMHPHQMRHAARLDRKAARAAFNGNYRKAARLRRHASRVRSAARHGF